MKKILILLALTVVCCLSFSDVKSAMTPKDSVSILLNKLKKMKHSYPRSLLPQVFIEAWKGDQEIRFRINEATETLEVWIRDAHAQVVIRRQFYGNETLSNSIDISPLPSGEYTLHFYPGDMPETEYSGKFYKKEEE